MDSILEDPRARGLRMRGRCGLACLMSAAAISHVAASPNVPVRTAVGNKRAAEQDAERLLADAALPPGAVRLSAEPSGDHGLLLRPPQEPRAEIIDRYGWCGAYRPGFLP
jgi:hypothetical protein